MARKLDIKQRRNPHLQKPGDKQTRPTGFDTEATWRNLSQQQNTALALSPQLKKWFGKELTIRLEV